MKLLNQLIVFCFGVFCLACASREVAFIARQEKLVQCTIYQDITCIKSFDGMLDKINNQNNDFRKTALHFAARLRNPEPSRILLKMGANANLFDDYGNTPLVSSLRVAEVRNSEANPDVISMVCAKTSPEFRNHLNKGNADALSYAIRYYSPEILEVLLNCDVKIKSIHRNYASKWLDERTPGIFSRDPASRQALAEGEAIKKILISHGLIIEP